MKRVFVIVFVMLIVAGAGVFALIYFKLIPNPFEAGAGANQEEALPATQAPGFTPPMAAPIMLPLEDIIVPVIIDGRVVKRVYITARIQITRGSMTVIQNGMPRLENAINQRLIVYLQEYFAKNRIIDPRGVKQEMQAAAQTVYGDRVEDVLLMTVFEQ
jgi:flagellar basal body-associated protein FliL